MIYLDYAATTPMSKEALQVYTKVSQLFFGNPSSLHDVGSDALQLLNMCREELAELLHASEKAIYFTSGGSEANILALRSLINAHSEKGKHLITTRTDHSSVYNFFQRLEQEGFEVTYLPVNKHGEINLEELRHAIKDTTILASIHHGNGEIGTIQPIEQIGALLHQHGILFHSDCVQTFGKVPIDVRKVQIDSLSISSHKIYGPKGVGAVYINPRIKWDPVIPNTSHEAGFRPGTVNVPGIASFVASAKSVCNDMSSEGNRLEAIKKCLADKLLKQSSLIRIEGKSANCLPHILGLRIDGIEGQYTMLECNRYGLAVSTGSACQVGNQSPCKTMVAIGRSDLEAKQFVRLSFGKHTKIEDIDKTVNVFETIIEKFFLVRGETNER